ATPGEKGYIDRVPVDKVLAWEAGLHQFLAASHQALIDQLDTGDWNDALEGALKNAMDAYVKQSAI
ncbi:MAG: F0F1 ATP synthase subunit alpha, partial [Sinobacteraceae bacterium]|nr:F0F1 ATP synthase subunit alpha [Nevskiaceae bacterium]